MEGYNEQRESHKKDREDALKTFYDQQNELNEIMHSLVGLSNRGLYFKDLDLFALNEEVRPTDQMSFTKVYSKGGVLFFNGFVKKYGEVGWHFHPDCYEEIEIKTGSLYEAVSKKTYNEGEIISLEKGIAHFLIALKDTRIHTKIIKSDG